MRQEWDPVKLTVNFWHGDPPVGGDTLRTKSGRQYMILETVKASDTGKLRALKCVVLPKDEAPTGTVFEWQWSPRKRKARR